MKYPKEFIEKAQELYPEPEFAYLHRWIQLGFMEAVGKVLKSLAVGPIKSCSCRDTSFQSRLSRELDEKQKLYKLWKELVYNK